MRAGRVGYEMGYNRCVSVLFCAFFC